VHLQSAREKRQARNALDAFGYATITVRVSDGKLMWQTPLARDLLLQYYGTSAPQTPDAVLTWLRRNLPDAERQIEPPRLSCASANHGARRLTFRLHQQTGDSEGGGDWLIIMREESDQTVIQAMSLSFKLTAREAEVLYWVVKGKINRDIGDILGTSPMTVKKHLERVFAKLGVETRTAAAGMAMSRIRLLRVTPCPPREPLRLRPGKAGSAAPACKKRAGLAVPGFLQAPAAGVTIEPSVKHQLFTLRPPYQAASFSNAALPRARIYSVFSANLALNPLRHCSISRRAPSQRCARKAHPARLLKRRLPVGNRIPAGLRASPCFPIFKPGSGPVYPAQVFLL